MICSTTAPVQPCFDYAQAGKGLRYTIIPEPRAPTPTTLLDLEWLRHCGTMDGPPPCYSGTDVRGGEACSHLCHRCASSKRWRASTFTRPSGRRSRSRPFHGTA